MTLHFFVMWAMEKTGPIRVYIETIPKWQKNMVFSNQPNQLVRTQDPHGWRLDQPWKARHIDSHISM